MGNWISKEKIFSYPEAENQEIRQALDYCIGQVKRNIDRYGDKFPNSNSVDGFYPLVENRGWTTGFWTGEVWLSYENTMGEEAELFREAGNQQVQSFRKRIDEKIDVDHHDMGFLYSPSCVAAYKLLGLEAGKEAALKAADQLISRFQGIGGFIQAWGAFGAADNYRFIIDCLLNLPLLYWASDETGDGKYREIAQRHIDTAMKYVIREDNSTWHMVFMNMETGEFDHGATCQGFQDGSAWTRGQVWGVYGAAVAYKYTRKKEYIDYFKRVSDYFLEHLPEDLCPYWDLTFGGESEGSEPRDSSSAAIVICGMLEMSKYMEQDDAAYYQGIAKRFLKSLIDHYQITDASESDGQLRRGTYCKGTPYNTCNDSGVDECVIWGDYYFMEALVRVLKPDWKIYW